ncbi:hypothetical protein ACFXKJ_28665 [Kitasatospora indigofera]
MTFLASDGAHWIAGDAAPSPASLHSLHAVLAAALDRPEPSPALSEG